MNSEEHKPYTTVGALVSALSGWAPDRIVVVLSPERSPGPRMMHGLTLSGTDTIYTGQDAEGMEVVVLTLTEGQEVEVTE